MKKQFIFGVMLLSLTGCNLLEDMKSFNNSLDNVVAATKGESINITTTNNNNVNNDELKNYFYQCDTMKMNGKYWTCSKEIYYTKYPSHFREYDDDGNRHGTFLCFKIIGDAGKPKKIEGVYVCRGYTSIDTFNKLYDEHGNKLKDADKKYNKSKNLWNDANKILYVLPDKINYPDYLF